MFQYVVFYKKIHFKSVTSQIDQVSKNEGTILLLLNISFIFQVAKNKRDKWGYANF